MNKEKTTTPTSSPKLSKGQNGKGSKPRPVNLSKFSKNYEIINWAKPAEIPAQTPLSKFQLAVGKCPRCRQYPTWFNDVPLTAFCWGQSPDEEHREWHKVVPGSAQPYKTRKHKISKTTKTK